MLKFAHTYHFWALLLGGFLAIAAALYFINRKQKLRNAGNIALLERLMPATSSANKTIKIIIALIALVALTVAWANPLIGTKYEKVERNGADIMFAIDVSTSMNAKDIVPSRMLKAKQLISNLISSMSNDRIGLIVFAGNAYLQMPITVDYSGAEMYLKNVNTQMVPKQGTNIAEAIRLAINSFDEGNDKYRVLFIISDGEDHDSEALAMVKKARELGIIINTVGVGTDKPTTIPIDDKGNLKKDFDGNIVETQLNEDMLKELASEGGGKYFSAASLKINEQLLDNLSLQDKRKIDEKVFTSFKNHFPLFLGIAFILLLIEWLLPERKLTWFTK